MKAVVYRGPLDVAVEEVEDPGIEHPTDAIVRVTSSAVCGSDLHIYEGRTAALPGLVLGHEPLGVVEEAGDAVVSLGKGERVVVSFNIACGHCYNCVRGETSACLTANPAWAGAGFGIPGLGDYRGAQAEYLRVPFADMNCTKLPGEPGDDLEDDFLLLADIFPTGYHATRLARVSPGSAVAVFGAGPVGLLAAYSSILTGAGEVYVVDFVGERLDMARRLGAIPVDAGAGDPVEQIFGLRADSRLRGGSLLPVEEKMRGVMCGIDAVGHQARDRGDSAREDPAQVIEDLVRLVDPTGSIGVIGLYTAYDPGGDTDEARSGLIELHWGTVWLKQLSIGTGSTPVKRYSVMLRDLIIAGRARPGFVVTHRLPLEAAPEAYRMFSERTGGCVKVVLKTEM